MFEHSFLDHTIPSSSGFDLGSGRLRRAARATVPCSSKIDIDKPSFVFKGIGYFHRWSLNDQHEFTPSGQEDLEEWADMITMNVYPDVHDGDTLAARTNAVLENYKNAKAMVLKTDSVPRTPDRPAEHFCCGRFWPANFIEVAYPRFKLVDGIGCSIVYSHRMYGEKIGDQMSAWLKANGAEMEKGVDGMERYAVAGGDWARSAPDEKLDVVEALMPSACLLDPVLGSQVPNEWP